jgi:hypothetical protein
MAKNRNDELLKTSWDINKKQPKKYLPVLASDTATFFSCPEVKVCVLFSYHFFSTIIVTLDKESTMKHLTKHFIIVVAGLILCLSITGCGGGGAKMEARTTTVGQELIDLQKAYDQGILSEKEYTSMKESMIKKNK